MIVSNCLEFGFDNRFLDSRRERVTQLEAEWISPTRQASPLLFKILQAHTLIVSKSTQAQKIHSSKAFALAEPKYSIATVIYYNLKKKKNKNMLMY